MLTKDEMNDLARRLIIPWPFNRIMSTILSIHYHRRGMDVPDYETIKHEIHDKVIRWDYYLEDLIYNKEMQNAG